MAESFRHMADQAILNIMRMTTQMLIAAAIQKLTGQKQAMSNAYHAAAATWHTVAESQVGGVLNPVIAAAEAAAVFAAVAGFASFEHGGVVPKTQIALVHGGERMLTEKQNSTFECLVEGGSGPSNHYHAAPGESPDSVTKNTAAYQRAMRDGRLRFA